MSADITDLLIVTITAFCLVKSILTGIFEAKPRTPFSLMVGNFTKKIGSCSFYSADIVWEPYIRVFLSRSGGDFICEQVIEYASSKPVKSISNLDRIFVKNLGVFS